MAKIISHKTDADFYPVEFDLAAAESAVFRVFPNYSLCYVVEGKLKYTLNRTEFTAGAGDMYLIFPDTAITLEPVIETIITRLGLNGARAAALFDRVGINTGNPVMRSVPAVISGKLSEFREFADLTNPAADLTAQSKLYELMAVIADAVTRTTVSHIEKDKQMAEALQFINENYMNPDFSITDVAAHIDFNPNYLSRKFKEYTGKSFSKYLIEVRLGHACTLIEEGIHSIKTVSELTGYSNQLYFSKEFKKEVGCTPKDYRARCHGRAD